MGQGGQSVCLSGGGGLGEGRCGVGEGGMGWVGLGWGGVGGWVAYGAMEGAAGPG